MYFLGEVEIFLFVLPIEWCGHEAVPQQKLFEQDVSAKCEHGLKPNYNDYSLIVVK